MATISAIEARSVHQIQSGQVIVDLCSVVKELVENSLDAGATSIEVRFKNHGLDLIEVQDNGTGIPSSDYENVALKHYTSKLSTYDDLSSLQTFGFRGEALSSLCALSDFHVITAQAHEAPRAARLDFEVSGKLKKTQTVAGQKGTTASVENLFRKLPVRRRELEKNIKREYGKVLGLLHAYACISTGVRFSVKNSVAKATTSVVVFATKVNPTTRENIANIYGAKTLLALIPLDLTLEFEPSSVGKPGNRELNKIHVRGHISRPVFGEGRQTPDRQLFFVNSRPCGLPQISKAFNEVYKSFNVSQSPFIFADFQMDTNAYDVNVSPDKRTILLHDSGPLIESLKDSLTRLFEESDQTVPVSHISGRKQNATKHPRDGLQNNGIPERETIGEIVSDNDSVNSPEEGNMQPEEVSRTRRLSLNELQGRGGGTSEIVHDKQMPSQEIQGPPTTPSIELEAVETSQTSNQEHSELVQQSMSNMFVEPESEEASQRMTEVQQIRSLQLSPSARTSDVIQSAFDRIRPKRTPTEVATIVVGDKTITSTVGSSRPRKTGLEVTLSKGSRAKRKVHTPSRPDIFGKNLRSFALSGRQEDETSDAEIEEDISERESEVDGETGNEISESTGSAPSPHGQGNPSSHEDESPRRTGKPRRKIQRYVEGIAKSDEASINGGEKRAQDEAQVQELIRQAEEKAARLSGRNVNRVNKFTKSHARQYLTSNLVGEVDCSLPKIKAQLERSQKTTRACTGRSGLPDREGTAPQEGSAEERLSLTVTKDDFATMRVVGQFNLGFILATRSSKETPQTTPGLEDELFIIDQHASDEKYNFERLQAETVVQNQPLVQPLTLDLTAVEEEVILENRHVLEKNGFVVEIDDSGNERIGRRCKLVSLPLSKEVVFTVRDLEELIALLSESPAMSTSKSGAKSDLYIPRPSKVRKMFAMRACRSSIMIGKTLTPKQMEKVIRHMGTIDKPWNCPHGRPTMRHLMGLVQWHEYDEYAQDAEAESNPVEMSLDSGGLHVWKRFFEWQSEMNEEKTADSDPN